MNELVPYSELKEMAAQVVKGGLFPGIKTPEQALTLFLVAQAEGLHPMTATMRYNIIQNRPAMKAEAMLASFFERGGQVDWNEYTDEAVTGFFTSPGVPKGVSVRWTMADAKRAGVTMNQTWTKYPRQMLKARVASDGVRMTDPAVNQGRYTPEEVSEFTPTTDKVEAEIIAPEPPQAVPEALGPVMTVEESRNAAIQGWDHEQGDLTHALEASIDQVKAEKAVASALDAAYEALDALDGQGCNECNGEIGAYVSKKGTPYLRCKFAHDLFLEYLDKGKTKAMASAMTKDHFYRLLP